MGNQNDNDYPVDFQKNFNAPVYSAKKPTTAERSPEQPSILDEKSFMEYDDVSMNDNLPTPRGFDEDPLKNQLDETVQRNLEKYSFNL